MIAFTDKHILKKSISLLLFCLLLPGCSTFRTISAAGPDTPIFFSGTRLNVESLRKSEKSIKTKFRVAPPKHPVIDMPFSLAFDTVLIPLTAPVALYETTIGRIEESAP